MQSLLRSVVPTVSTEVMSSSWVTPSVDGSRTSLLAFVEISSMLLRESEAVATLETVPVHQQASSIRIPMTPSPRMKVESEDSVSEKASISAKVIPCPSLSDHLLVRSGTPVALAIPSSGVRDIPPTVVIRIAGRSREALIS